MLRFGSTLAALIVIALPMLQHVPPLDVHAVPEPAPAPPAPPPRCPPGMALIARAPAHDPYPDYCIDRYEAPNAAGALPLAYQTAPGAEAWCAARGAALCTEDEWHVACRGEHWQPYPYGAAYVRGRCTDDKWWRGSPSLERRGITDIDWGLLAQYPAPAAIEAARALYQATPSGARPGCVTSAGVYDMAGNVAEWVRSPRTRWGYSMRGCYWAGCYGGAPPSCEFVNPAHPGTFRTYEAGFRCCAPAAAADP